MELSEGGNLTSSVVNLAAAGDGVTPDYQPNTDAVFPTDSVVSEEMLGELLKASSIACLVTISLALPACVLNALVTSLNRRDAYCQYLAGMSAANGLGLLCSLPYNILTFVCPSSFAYNFVQFYLNSIGATIFRRVAVVLNVLASVERFLTLIFPFPVSTSVLRRQPHLIVGCVLVATVVLYTPAAFEFSIVKVESDEWILVQSVVRLENQQLFFITRNIARALVFYAPLLLSLVVNTALIVGLKLHASKQQAVRAVRGKALQRGNRNGPDNGGHLQTTIVSQTCRLVLALSFAFFFLALPRMLNDTVSSYLPGYCSVATRCTLYRVISAFGMLPPLLTEPCLFLINFALSRQFRKVVPILLRSTWYVSKSITESKNYITAA